jgi:hypothetical protein
MLFKSLSAEMFFCQNEIVRRIGYNVFQARAVPVVRKVKCTNVQRDAKMQNEQAWILLGVMRACTLVLVELLSCKMLSAET